jgi:hypothetical protein
MDLKVEVVLEVLVVPAEIVPLLTALEVKVELVQMILTYLKAG